MFLVKINNLKPFIIIPLFLFFIACTSIIPRKTQHISALNWTQDDNTPKTVVILPFDNDTAEKDLEILVRRSFYNHFSSKDYRDFELSEIDRALKIVQKTSSKTWRNLSPSDLGELFHADLIIYGRIKEFNKIFLGIYSQIALKVEVKIVRPQSGDVVWRKTLSKRSHDGGIPLNPLGIIPAALRSGLHMRSEKIIELIDRVNREIVPQIPNPPIPPISPFFFYIQVASFLEKKQALETIKQFEGKGLNPQIETVMLGDHLWHRIILGPYLKPSKAEKVRSTIAQNPKFQPILIQHSPDWRDKGLKMESFGE